MQVQEDSISHARVMKPLPVRQHLHQPKLIKLLSVPAHTLLLALAIHALPETPIDCVWLYNHTASPQLKLQDDLPVDHESISATGLLSFLNLTTTSFYASSSQEHPTGQTSFVQSTRLAPIRSLAGGLEGVTWVEARIRDEELWRVEDKARGHSEY